MAFTFERANYQEIRRMIFDAIKVIVGFLILIYFGGNLVICNEDIPFCDKRLEELKNDVKLWRKRCLNGTVNVPNSTCCATEKEQNQQRMSMQTKLCFYEGKYSILLYKSSDLEVFIARLMHFSRKEKGICI
jgi:hypothetical protein